MSCTVVLAIKADAGGGSSLACCWGREMGMGSSEAGGGPAGDGSFLSLASVLRMRRKGGDKRDPEIRLRATGT